MSITYNYFCVYLSPKKSRYIIIEHYNLPKNPEVMKQDYSKYTEKDQAIWRFLFTEQLHNLQGNVCQEFLDCLDELHTVFNADRIPRFDQVNAKLMKKTGWQIHVVPGLIPVLDFFEHLKNKRFCASTWLRTPEELHYIEEPDMFHDVFGHIPLYMNEDYADFTQRVGEVALKWKDDSMKIKQLQRLYWFTIEFGVINRYGKTKSYGAGIISSIEETRVVANKGRTFAPYDIKEIIDKEFNIDTIQPVYFEIDNFRQLYDSLDILDELFEAAA